MSKKPVVLMVLDGYGLNDRTEGNAIAMANTPVMDKLMKECPFVQGQASGLAVGLPDGQMGNSEVGHMNIGAGRIIYQDLTRITKAIQDGEGDLFALSQSEEMMPVSGVIETGRGCELLIDDYNLVNGLKEFLLTQTGFEEQERAQTLKDVSYLQRGYASGGRYARDEKKNPRDNANTIKHLVNLINMNGPLSEAKKDSLYSFLKQRYSLEGKNG